MLEVEKLNISYRQTQVLWDVSFAVTKGEIVSIIGPNGAGKSTLLKAVMGAVKASQGSIIKFEGVNITGLSPHNISERGITLVPEGRGIFFDLSVLENLDLGAITKRSKSIKKDNLQRCFNLFPILKERKEQLAGTLSGGEMQMLAIARGLMSNPALLMVDEPSLGLAPKVFAQILSVLGQINSTEGLTVLLVEQNVSKALKFSNRTYVLEVGRIVLAGDSKELIAHPHVKRAYLGR
jgi:branched-chain amino acid transport system ATP-binding protein